MSIADKMQTMTDPVWMYKNGIGEIFERDDVPNLGPEWKDTPANETKLDIDDIEDKNLLEAIASEYGVILDKRKNIETLRDEVKGLVNGNG